MSSGVAGSASVTTDRDDSTIARAAIIGLSESPNVGNRTPAAIGMASVTTGREGDHTKAIAARDATRTTGATINIAVRPYRVALGNPRSGNSTCRTMRYADSPPKKRKPAGSGGTRQTIRPVTTAKDAAAADSRA